LAGKDIKRNLKKKDFSNVTYNMFLKRLKFPNPVKFLIEKSALRKFNFTYIFGWQRYQKKFEKERF